MDNQANGEKPTPTFGQRAAGVSFNPSKLPDVDELKTLSAALIDKMNQMREATEDGEVKAQFTLAIRKIQEGKMWAVNAATWNL